MNVWAFLGFCVLLGLVPGLMALRCPSTCDMGRGRVDQCTRRRGHPQITNNQATIPTGTDNELAHHGRMASWL